MSLLEARRVRKVFGGGLWRRTRVVALENFSLVFDEDTPSFTAVVGESGSGKTTLARLLLGLIEPTSGEVRFRGIPLRSLDRAGRRCFLREVQAVFQDPYEAYNPFYKVDHVLELPIRNFGLARDRRTARALIEEALAGVGLRVEETLGRYPHQLSGGQRQRIMVARALLLRPRILIADEPVSMVDASLRATILRSLLDLHRDHGVSVLYITHDLTTAYQVSHDIVVLYRGGVVEAGRVEAVVREPAHPYTRLLVGSIPLPRPDRPWRGERVLGQPAGLLPLGPRFCQFLDRCPFAMPICQQEVPPLFQLGSERAVACFLYRDQPVLSNDDLADLLCKRTATSN
jgi:peptide/nickel transport system ATP-binding protein